MVILLYIIICFILIECNLKNSQKFFIIFVCFRFTEVSPGSTCDTDTTCNQGQPQDS